MLPSPRKSKKRSLYKQPPSGSLSPSPSKISQRKLKWFNILFGLLTISGLIVSALGGRTRLSRGASALIEATPSSVVLTWQGQSSTEICKQLTIYNDGHFQSAACGQTGSDQVLSTADITQVKTWVSTYQAFTFHPYTKDGIPVVQLNFEGYGPRAATAEEQHAIEIFAEVLASQN